MPTLNRFPLLGLWAKEAAGRLGYDDDDSATLGHAYAVLYAIRAQTAPVPKHAHAEDGPAAAPALREEPDLLDLGGDRLEVRHTAAGQLQGVVGRGTPQTPRSYRVSVRGKFPGDYHDRLGRAFREVWETHDPQSLRQGRLIYRLYDQWKKACAAGRLVDLDKLLKWCQDQS